MTSIGVVEHLAIAADTEEPMEASERVEAVEGRGVRGGRYYEGRGLCNVLDEEGETQEASQITFIEAEALDAIDREDGITTKYSGEVVTEYGSDFEPWGRAGVTILRNIVTTPTNRVTGSRA